MKDQDGQDKTLERPMTDDEKKALKGQLADKVIEKEQLEEEIGVLTSGRKEIVKKLKIEITQIRHEVRRGVVTERNPDYVGRSD